MGSLLLTKKSWVAMVALFAAGISLTAGATPPVEDAASAAEGAHSTSLIMLDHPVSLPDSIEAAPGLEFDVIGYRYLNVGVEGEFFPAPEYSAEQFRIDFDAKFGMAPAVVGLVVRATDNGGSNAPVSKSGEPLDTPGRGLLAGLDEFTPPGSEEGTLWDAARAAEVSALEAEASKEAAEAAVPDAAAAAAINDFHPGFSQITLSTGSGGQALINTQHVWTAARETAAATPNYWGLEFKVDLVNKTIRANNPTGIRQDPLPHCTDYPNVEDRFWAKNYNFYSWSVYQIGAAGGATVGAYLDSNDLQDECYRQSLSVGIGFPRRLPYTPNRNQQLGTEIIARPGTSSRVDNIVTGLIAAKEGYSCGVPVTYPGSSYNLSYYIPATDCMGANVALPFPSTRQKNFALLSERGAAYASDHLRRVQVTTVVSGMPSPGCVYRDKLVYKDSDGNPVPQRACVAS